MLGHLEVVELSNFFLFPKIFIIYTTDEGMNDLSQ